MSPGASTCSGAAFMPSVNTGGCSRNQISSAVSGPRCSVNACIARHVGSYSARPSHRSSGWTLAASGVWRSATTGSTCNRLLLPQAGVVALERTLGSIARPHQRAGDAFEKAFCQRHLAITLEVLRRHPALDGEVIRSRSQILAEGEQVDARCTNVVHRRRDLFLGLAQAEHHAGLRQHVGTRTLRVRENLQRLFVACARIAYRMRQTPHGFDVLCEDVEATADDSLDVGEHALEIRCERFDGGRWIEALDLAHAGREMAGAAVRQI